MSRRKTPTPDIDPTLPPPMREQVQAALRRYVENFYDIQELRLQTGGRTYKRPTGVTIELHPSDLARLGNQTKALQQAEKVALADVDMALGRIGFYRDVVLPHKDDWKGLGPTMWGVLLSSFAIEKEDTVSKMWAFAGLRPMPAWRCKGCQSVICSATESEGFITQPHPKLDEASKNCPKATPQATKLLGPGDVFYSAQSQRPTKGAKLTFNKWLRTKLVGVMGPVVLQSCVYRCPKCGERMKKHPAVKDDFIHADTEAQEDWKEGAQPMSPAALKCGTFSVGKGEVVKDQAPFTKWYYDYRHRKQSAGWGRNDAHRHQAAIRYMVKMILLKLWTAWRTYEQLPVRPSYHEEKMGHVHGGGAAPSTIEPRSELDDEDPLLAAKVAEEVALADAAE